MKRLGVSLSRLGMTTKANWSNITKTEKKKRVAIALAST